MWGEPRNKFIKTRSKARSLNRQLLTGLFSTVTILSRSASVSSSRTNVGRVWISVLKRIKRKGCHILHSWAVYRVEFEGLFKYLRGKLQICHGSQSLVQLDLHSQILEMIDQTQNQTLTERSHHTHWHCSQHKRTGLSFLRLQRAVEKVSTKFKKER